MNFDFDEVVGADQVCSTIAYYLSFNTNVALIDERKQIRYSLQCAGHSFISEIMENTQNNFLAFQILVRIFDDDRVNSGKVAWNIPSRYVVSVINSNDLNWLNEYHNEFEDKYIEEFKYWSKVQKAIGLLPEDNLYYFLKLKGHDCEKIISEYGDMDTQAVLLKKFVKIGLFSKILPYFLFNKNQRFLN